MKDVHFKFNIPKDKVIVALDGIKSLEDFKALVALLSPIVGWFKIGTEAMLQYGAPILISIVKNAGARVFCDLKLHDIPATCRKTASNFRDADMINIHCSAGIEAMERTLEAVSPETLVIGVTVLTSFNEENCTNVYNSSIEAKVRSFTRKASFIGLDGIVCSPQDIESLKKFPWFENMLRITPGIQPQWMQANDPKRVMTPYEAIKAGATALVIGRAITAPPQDSLANGNPVIAARVILEEIQRALNEMQNASS